MYRTSKIFKVQNKGGSYKTKGLYYSFSRNDGNILVFTTKTGKYDIPEIGKYWELRCSDAKKFFKMIGSAVDPIKFEMVFKNTKFFNMESRITETINLYPSRQTLIRNKIKREIEELKNESK